MDRAWYRETGGAPVASAEIGRKGRTIRVRRPPAGPRGSPLQTCARSRSARDYLAIVAQYSTIFLDHVPHLGPHLRNETKRFIILVDALYDQGARLFASADANRSIC